ncbi:MAG TPA: hypothetical protein DEB31_07150 [Clostridiales bacterium]|nr:hypothetical protein [Clostridiales bacterium]
MLDCQEVLPGQEVLTEKYNRLIGDIDEQVVFCKSERETLQNEYDLLTRVLEQKGASFTDAEKEVLQNDLKELRAAMDYLKQELQGLMTARGYYLKTNSFISSFFMTGFTYKQEAY